MSALRPWQEVIDSLEESGAALLLGNGFSIAFDQAFRYQSLLTVCAEHSDQDWQQLFRRLNTSNFEAVMASLTHTGEVLSHLKVDVPSEVPRLCDELRKDFILGLKEIHLSSARDPAFLKHRDSVRSFTGKFSDVFTTNYDLLLYWSDVANDAKPRFSDGFGHAQEGGELEFTGAFSACQRWNLHGALHLFTSDSGRTFKLKGAPKEGLIDLVEKSMNEGRHPLLVFEGSSLEKQSAIRGNEYLSTAYSRFKALTGVLVTYGFSFGERDQHIRDAIESSAVTEVWVGLTNEDPDRPQFRNKKVHHFDSKSVDPWSKGSSQ